MAAEITIRENDMAEMAYVGATPWHGLGQNLPENTSIEEWQKAAGLDWWLERSPVMCMQDGMLVQVPNSDVLYRSDNGKPLSIVSGNYKEVQPEKVLHFFSDLVESYGFQMETAGSLREGRRIWALARTGQEGFVVNGDKVKSYLLLSTSCDGSLATTAMFTTIRVVCSNTLQYSIREDGMDAIRVRHCSVFDPVNTKKDLGIYATRSFDTFMADMRRMAEKPVSNYQAEKMLTKLFADSRSEKPVTEMKGFRTIMDLFNGAGRGADMDGVQGTAWGLINAVTEYADYHARAKSQDYRLNNAWFGRTADMKEQIVQLAMAA